MLATFNQEAGEQVDSTTLLASQVKEIKNKLRRLENRFIEEELTKELYLKNIGKLLDEKTQIEAELTKMTEGVSNLEECVEKVISYSLNLASVWSSADYTTKQRIQFWLFPEGISYNKENDGCRTFRINSVFRYIACQKQGLLNEKSGIPELNIEYSALVAGSRIELPTSGL